MSRIYLNDDWIFEESYSERMSEKNYVGGRRVRLPHTTKELPLHYFDERAYQMLCGYRRELFAPEEWRGKSVLLTLEGAAHSAWVYLNGELLGEHHCGYTAFSVELGDHLRFGETNLLVVKVDSREQQNIPPFGYVVDYMTYGGIYRDVYLDVRNRVHIADEFVQTRISMQALTDARGGLVEKARLAVELSVAGLENEADFGPYTVRQSLVPENADHGRRHRLTEAPLTAAHTVLKGSVSSVRLWSVEEPCLYLLKTQLLRDGEVIDETEVRFGFRRAEFKADGFYLNGKKRRLRGLNRHQSYPYVGYAMPESMQKLDADILKKELGCNAVRTSHYPQSHYFVDRCDELGLLVFMEIPGWQHIGDAEWKNQAVENVRDMVRQYRNHTSIILWGVRINESGDDEAFYRETNRVAHELDSRPTGGVRNIRQSQLLEDVYTYNDFLHDGISPGCDPKAKVTPDMGKAYLVSEYNGHMYPAKSFDWEGHRVEHAIRHANVLDAVAKEADIAGSFGWCMFDYNTHKDFGSGDRICYHGVMDMFRNPKLAAAVYACEQEETPILEVSSTMDMGEHPACNRGETYIFSNADSVRMYKNGLFLKEYHPSDSPYRYLKHGPLVIDDFVGEELVKQENFAPHQAELVKSTLSYVALHGYGHLPAKVVGMILECMTVYHMKPKDAVDLYTKYIGNWGRASTVYRFEAIQNGEVVKTVTKEPMSSAHLTVRASHTRLVEKHSYDVASVRIRAVDDHDNLLYFFQEPIELRTEGPIALIGPKVLSFSGGMTGTYVRTTGEHGEARLWIRSEQAGEEVVKFRV